MASRRPGSVTRQARAAVLGLALMLGAVSCQPAASSNACGEDAGEAVTIRLAHAMDPSHPVHRSIEFMADRLAEKSDGTMQVEIYPAEQLGSERQLLELVQIGSLDMTKVSSAVMSGFAEPYQLFSLPYLFRDAAHRYAVMEGAVGRDVLLSSTPVGLRGLSFYDSGSRSFYTTGTPVRTPADLRGLKIRTMNSPVSIRMVNMMGGAATPISWGELYTALQQGVVDGAENNAPSFYLTRHYELCDYYSLDQHTSPQDVLMAGTRLWERLTPQQRTWLQEAADASAQRQKVLWAEAREEAMQAVKEAGVEILRPDKEPFMKAVQPLYERLEAAQPQIHDLVQRVRALDATTVAGLASQQRTVR